MEKRDAGDRNGSDGKTSNEADGADDDDGDEEVNV